MNFDNYVNLLEKRLSVKRWEHSLRVMDTALAMAPEFQLPGAKVRLASLLHDLAKDMSAEELLALARRERLLTCPAEEAQPDLLHGPVGAVLCREELGISDAEVLDAIRYHTTGHAPMSPLDILIYLADLIEPGRDYPGSDELRLLCRQDWRQGLLRAFDETLRFVMERRLLIHPLTIEARNWWITMKGGMLWKPENRLS